MLDLGHVVENVLKQDLGSQRLHESLNHFCLNRVSIEHLPQQIEPLARWVHTHDKVGILILLVLPHMYNRVFDLKHAEPCWATFVYIVKRLEPKLLLQ
jgi:hypothetical protein